jgi:hypothetical protein
MRMILPVVELSIVRTVAIQRIAPVVAATLAVRGGLRAPVVMGHLHLEKPPGPDPQADADALRMHPFARSDPAMPAIPP